MNGRCIIIAEAGVNHNGNLQMAKELIDVAADAGVDYIKFQTFKADKLAGVSAPQADYQSMNNNSSDSQIEMLKKLELSFEDFEFLNEYAKTRHINFLSTPFDEDSIEFLSDIGMDYMKIPSGEITNLPYLRNIARHRIPIIMSTGMSTIKEIEDAMSVLMESGIQKEDIILLHCNTEYPTPMNDVNLRAMNTLSDKFGVKVGYSDHTKGIEIPIAAVALGAKVIEKHFTLDRSLPGPDHKASLEPQELRQMVQYIRNVENAMGDGEKRVTESEKKNITVARKSIVASGNIKIGEVFSESNLTAKRPGTGISPMKWEVVIGKIANREYQKDELIDFDVIDE